MKRGKKAAMEMSVGTIVTIVLLMAVLVLGLTLTRTIFRSASNSIDNIDAGVQDQINDLFAQDNLQKMVVYPGRSVSIKKGGSDSGFAFSIRNLGSTGEFSYDINAMDSDCNINKDSANGFISLGKSGSGINIPSANVLEYPILVKFKIPDSAPACEIRYTITVKKAGETDEYSHVDVDLKIISK